MWTQDSALLLLLACCLWSAEAQREKRQSIWDEPITFKSKIKDSCSMTITGQGHYTRMKLSCDANRGTYSCEYVGTPYTCRPYNTRPRHYFVQMMWRIRKFQNACQAPRQIKPHMCRFEGDDSQMVFVAGSFKRTAGTRPAPQPARPQPRPAPTKQNDQDPKQKETTPRPTTNPTTTPTTNPTTTPTTNPTTNPTTTPTTNPTTTPTTEPTTPTTEPTTPTMEPTTPPEETKAKKMAKQHCWRSLQGLCSYFIGLFHKN